jgi:hypothetical protein
VNISGNLASYIVKLAQAVVQEYTPAPGGSSALQVATVTLTADQIKLLGGTPVVVVPSPGSGKYIFPLAWAMQYKAGSEPYNPGVGAFQLGSTAHPAYGSNINPMGLIDLATNQISATIGSDVVVAQIDAENEAVLISAESNPYIGGVIADSVLNNPGDGFAPGDTFSVAGSLQNAANGVVDTISGGGETGPIATYHLTSFNGPYNTAVNVPLNNNSALGHSATIDITAPVQGNGTLTVIAYYIVVDL